MRPHTCLRLMASMTMIQRAISTKWNTFAARRGPRWERLEKTRAKRRRAVTRVVTRDMTPEMGLIPSTTEMTGMTHKRRKSSERGSNSFIRTRKVMKRMKKASTKTTRTTDPTLMMRTAPTSMGMTKRRKSGGEMNSETTHLRNLQNILMMTPPRMSRPWM